MAAGFYDLFMQLQGSGFYEFLLPFLLVFAVIFGILQKSNLFGSGQKGINAVVAIVLGLLITSQFEVVRNLTTFLPRMSYFIIIAMMVLIFIALFAGGEIQIHGFALAVVVIAALLGTYWALGPAMGFDVPFWLTQNWMMIAVLMIVLFLIVVVIKGGEKFDNATERQSVHKARRDASDARWNSWFGRGASPPEK